MVHTVPEQELNISKKMTTMETWTFYLRRLFIFARLSYYFIAVLRLTKLSTLLSAPVLASTQQVSIVVIEKLLIYFSQNGHFWNGVTSTDFFAFCCENWHKRWMNRHLVSVRGGQTCF